MWDIFYPHCLCVVIMGAYLEIHRVCSCDKLTYSYD